MLVFLGSMKLSPILVIKKNNKQTNFLAHSKPPVMEVFRSGWGTGIQTDCILFCMVKPTACEYNQITCQYHTQHIANVGAETRFANHQTWRSQWAWGSALPGFETFWQWLSWVLLKLHLFSLASFSRDKQEKAEMSGRELGAVQTRLRCVATRFLRAEANSSKHHHS